MIASIWGRESADLKGLRLVAAGDGEDGAGRELRKIDPFPNAGTGRAAASDDVGGVGEAGSGETVNENPVGIERGIFDTEAIAIK